MKKGDTNPLSFIVGTVIIMIMVFIILFGLYVLAPDFTRETLGMKRFLDPFVNVTNPRAVDLAYTTVPENTKRAFDRLVGYFNEAKKNKKSCYMKIDHLPEFEKGSSIRLSQGFGKFSLGVYSKTGELVDRENAYKTFDGEMCVLNAKAMVTGQLKITHYITDMVISGTSSASLPRLGVNGKLNSIAKGGYETPYVYFDQSGNMCFMLLKEALVGENAWVNGAYKDEYLFNDDLDEIDRVKQFTNGRNECR